ncbi:MAG: hypothetical protein GQ529_03560, partial [Methyloprofundus sp.]|nr:hypothetical protein [Methyloprofundus sp.]
DTEYDLQIDVYQYPPSVAGAMGAILTGLTLLLIPSSSDTDTTVEIKLVDQSGNTAVEYVNTDGKTFWIGLFSVFMIDSFGVSHSNEVIHNQIRNGIKNIDISSLTNKILEKNN